MKAKRLLFLVMAICLACGVKAQFYDGPDDIYYYVEYKNGSFVENGCVLIFNFDGIKAAELSGKYSRMNIWYRAGVKINDVKDNIKSNPLYYEEKVESEEYELTYMSNKAYQCKSIRSHQGGNAYINFNFSSDRNTLDFSYHYWYTDPLSRLNGYYGWKDEEKTYKRVDKSFFKVGRSRTPSGTLHE